MALAALLPPPLPPLWGGGFLVAFAQLAAFYYALGALLHWGLPALLGPRLKGIQEAPRRPGEVARDALNSLGPIAVKAFMWTVVEQLHARGISRLYAGPVRSAREAAYLLLCVLVLDVLHDTWFYWTHRLLHWRPLYRWVHWEHHRSTSPSAFTGYAFHVGEALLVFANEVLVAFLLPLHMGLHRAYHIATTVIHEAGHVGYELSPFIPTLEGVAALLACGLAGSRALNTVQHHDLHHRFPRRHFSLYFTHWDRWCGTLHPKYDAGLFRYGAGGGGGGQQVQQCGKPPQQQEQQEEQEEQVGCEAATTRAAAAAAVAAAAAAAAKADGGSGGGCFGAAAAGRCGSDASCSSEACGAAKLGSRCSSSGSSGVPVAAVHAVACCRQRPGSGAAGARA